MVEGGHSHRLRGRQSKAATGRRLTERKENLDAEPALPTEQEVNGKVYSCVTKISYCVSLTQLYSQTQLKFIHRHLLQMVNYAN